MRPLKLLPLILVLTSSMLWCVPPSAQACKEGPTSALVPERIVGGNVEHLRTPLCGTPDDCGVPETCTRKNPSPPFVRDPSSENVPNFSDISCFAVVRKPDSNDPNGSVHYLFN
jgi:hypothetical protein